jgi:hypothetical protein
MTSLRRWLAHVTTAAAALLAAGLAAAAQAPLPVSAASESVRDITGTWEGTFRLDSTWRLDQRASARSVPARIRFSQVGDATATTTSSRSVHPGTFEIDFSRFGFTLSTSEALGWSLNDDAMRAVLNPTVDHGLVEVHGTFRGDAIAGTWRYVADPGGASGTFEIKRVAR